VLQVAIPLHPMNGKRGHRRGVWIAVSQDVMTLHTMNEAEDVVNK
jgi:hypothetical protein